MRQLVFVKRNILEWQEVPAPALSGGDALVRPLAIARCDLDLPMLRGDTLIRPPFPFGHEFVGEIVDLADDVPNFEPGQRVAVAFQISCGACPDCQRRYSQNCRSVDFASAYGLGRPSRQWGGAFQELIRVPFAAAMLLPLPATIDPVTIASLSDNLSDAYRTVGPYLQGEDRWRRTLVVAGRAHSIALYAVQIAVALGSAEVRYVDTDRNRLEHAERLGARVQEIADYSADIGQAEVVVEASNDPAGFAAAIRAAAPGGVVTPASIFFQNDLPLPYLDMYNKTVTLNAGRVASASVMPQALSLVEQGRWRPEEVTTRVASWEEAPEAMHDSTTKLIFRCA